MSIVKQLADKEYVQSAVDNLNQTLKLDLDAKQNIPNLITSPIESNTLMLSDNTEYRLTNISTLTLQYPNEDFEVWMRISFSETEFISVTFPTETKFIGISPTFGNAQIWEISIKDGVAVCWRVE